MRVLFLGNSFTYYHDLPVLAHGLTGWETDSVTRGGAYLREFLNPEDELCPRREAAFQNGKWDYVVLQEQSFNAVGDPKDFLNSVKCLCEKIRAIGAKPVLYCSWAYAEGGPCLERVQCTYQQMLEGLIAGYTQAARENEALLSPVGQAFAAMKDQYALYDPDTLHPSLYGSYLAACVICNTIAPDLPFGSFVPEGMEEAAAMAMQCKAKER